jgi:lysophospholipase L1-like esterase
VTKLLIRVIAAAALIAACSGAPSSTLTPSAPPNPRATPTQSPPEPTAVAATPVGIIAIGHSGLTGEGTAGPYEANPAASWATGNDLAVNSVYMRLVAARPETRGVSANTARGGAVASELRFQAASALAIVPAPSLIIVQTIDNDIQCDAANVTEFGQSVASALAFIHDASPSSKILVVGQMGRPSVSYITDLVAQVPEQKQALTWDDECTFFDTSGMINEPGFAKLTAAIDAYEAEEARICATVPNCFTDGGVRKQWIDKIEYFSSDFAHLNKTGQAAEAEQIWPVVEQVLGL